MIQFKKPTYDPFTSMVAHDLQEPSIGEAASAGFSRGLKFGPISSAYRFVESKIAGASSEDKRVLSSEEANKKYGLNGRLQFDNDVNEELAQILHKRKLDEITMEDTANRTRGLLTAVNFTSDMAAAILDPLNIAVSFIPVVGEARFAQMIGRYGLTSARFSKGIVEGAIGNMAVEPIILANALDEQADYDAYDSLMNTTFGSLLGGGLHVTAGKVADIVKGLKSKTHVDAVKTAVAQVADSKPVEVTPILASDPHVKLQEIHALEWHSSYDTALSYINELKEQGFGKQINSTLAATERSVVPFEASSSPRSSKYSTRLTDSEKVSLATYLGPEYRTVNDFLRFGVIRKGYEQSYVDKLVDELDTVIDKHVVSDNVQVLRGITDKIDLDNIPIEDLTGLKVSDKGFVSASLLSTDFSGVVESHVVIDVPRGSKGIFVDASSEVRHSGSELELLLPRNSEFIIKSVSENGGVRAYNVELLNDSPHYRTLEQIKEDSLESLAAKNDFSSNFSEGIIEDVHESNVNFVGAEQEKTLKSLEKESEVEVKNIANEINTIKEEALFRTEEELDALLARMTDDDDLDSVIAKMNSPVKTAKVDAIVDDGLTAGGSDRSPVFSSFDGDSFVDMTDSLDVLAKNIDGMEKELELDMQNANNNIEKSIFTFDNIRDIIDCME